MWLRRTWIAAVTIVVYVLLAGCLGTQPLTIVTPLNSTRSRLVVLCRMPTDRDVRQRSTTMTRTRFQGFAAAMAVEPAETNDGAASFAAHC